MRVPPPETRYRGAHVLFARVGAPGRDRALAGATEVLDAEELQRGDDLFAFRRCRVQHVRAPVPSEPIDPGLDNVAKRCRRCRALDRHAHTSALLHVVVACYRGTLSPDCG